jgi:citrate synthase
MNDLFHLVCEAHERSALRGNLSHHALRLAALGSGDYVKSICAALMTLGGIHAPISQTYDVLSAPSPLNHAKQLLLEGHRVPGWGNAFEKGHDDPEWAPVKAYIWANHAPMAGHIDKITKTLHDCGKDLYPNPSCYTAAAAIIMGLPRESAAVLFIHGRLWEWTKEFNSTRKSL